MTDKLKHLFNFDDLEIKKIENTTIKDRWHPVKRLLHPRAKFVRDDLVIYNTEIALRHILEHHENWLMSLKRRLLDVDDYSTSSGALGEIRAFGYLLWAGVSVNPVGKAGSDFLLSEGEEKAFVEVHSRQSNSDEAKALENFYNKLRKKDSHGKANQGSYFWDQHRTVPLGRPKIGETITENAINKLASIKGKEHQMSPDETSILWLDFQDEIWDGLDTRDRVLPLRTSTPNNAFQSGELWYAFYGWKDAPIYEEFRLDMLLGDVVKMRHDGRFRQDTKLDAVIISFSGDTIILENPYSQKPIKPWLWKMLVLLPRFNFEMSYTNWPAVNLKQRIELEQEKLKKLIEFLSIDL
ncbi:hypothetical protein [Microcoleus sp. herbarium2]|uniref:hypothetical protein n=1 Tax=Microcoleus sp. herbarium2 TaxID=3055433 RepID=UPI002FD2F8CD